MPGLKLEGVEFRVYRGSVLRATGRTARADYRREADEFLARTLEATLPRDGGDVRLEAAVGEGKFRAGTFTASGGLVLGRNDVTARSPSARYTSGPPEEIRGQEPVTVDGATWRLSGQGFVVDPRSGDLAVGGGVRLEAREAGGR